MKIYFNGLNGVRFFAAFLVIVGHIEGFKKKANIFSLFKLDWANTFISNAGPHGVKIFFTLSGFLITYLLLLEISSQGKIDIAKFYIRRALRIWPLYFLIVFLVFAVLPFCLDPSYLDTKIYPNTLSKFFLSVFFFPNAVFYLYGHIFSLGILWSIGTEEQFYIFWPHIIKYGFIKNIMKSILISILLITIIKLIIYLTRGYGPINWDERSSSLCYLFLQYDAMMIGGLFAALHFYHKEKMRVLFSVPLQIVVLIIALVMFFLVPELGVFSNLIFGPIYAIIILNIATNEKSILKLRQPVLEFFGQVSYGMYMFHSIMIAVSMALLARFGSSMGIISYNIYLYLASFVLTISISIASYYFFERKVLKFKAGFMVIQSGKTI